MIRNNHYVQIVVEFSFHLVHQISDFTIETLQLKEISIKSILMRKSNERFAPFLVIVDRNRDLAYRVH